MDVAPEQPVGLLVVIDPQKDFTHAQGAYARNHKGLRQLYEAKAHIEALLRRPPLPVVIVRSDYAPDQFGEGLSLAVPGTFGHQLDIATEEGWPILVKTAHSALSSADLRRYLAGNRIDTLVLCGFLAEYCVRQTALDALAAGYRVELLAEGIGTADDRQHRRTDTLAALERQGAKIVSYV